MVLFYRSAFGCGGLVLRPRAFYRVAPVVIFLAVVCVPPLLVAIPLVWFRGLCLINRYLSLLITAVQIIFIFIIFEIYQNLNNQ